MKSVVAHKRSPRTVTSLRPANVILVHGEEIGMGRLKAELEKQFALAPKDERPLVFNPKNCAEVKIEFHREKVAKAVGALARELGSVGRRTAAGSSRKREAFDIQGLLVNERFTKRLMAPADLDEYTLLKVGGIRQRLHVPYFSSAEALRAFVEEVFAEGSIEQEEGEFGTRLVVHGAVAATLAPPSATAARTKLLVEWDASPVNDMLADSIVALAAQAQTSPAGISLTSGGHHHHHHNHDHKHDHYQSSPTKSRPEDMMDVDGDGATKSSAKKAAIVASSGVRAGVIGKNRPSGLDPDAGGPVKTEGGGSKDEGDGGEGERLGTSAKVGAGANKTDLEDRERGGKSLKVIDAGVEGGKGEASAGARISPEEDSGRKNKGIVGVGDEDRDGGSGGDEDSDDDAVVGEKKETESLLLPKREASEKRREEEDGLSAAAAATAEEDGMILAMALLLIRHAMQDTFGKKAVTVREAGGEIDISTDGENVKLRVTVGRFPCPPASGGSGDGGGGGSPSRSFLPGDTTSKEFAVAGIATTAVAAEEGDAAWRCEVVECSKESLRRQVALLVERLRAAVSRN